MSSAGQIVALPPTDDETDEVVTHMTRVGFRTEARPLHPGTYEQEDTSLREHLERARIGLALGLVLGAVVGLALVLLVPGLRSLDLVVQAIFIAGIAIQGTIPVGLWQMGRAERDDDDATVLHEIDEERTIVVVDAPHRAGQARHVLTRHGVTFLADDHPAVRPTPRGT